MAETATREIIFKSSVNVKSMGSPQALVNKDGALDGQVFILGTIIGIAQGINRRADPKGGPDMIGLVGMFAAIPADPTKNEVRSKICYLPDAVHDPVAAMLAKAQEKDPTDIVKFAMEASCRKGGTAGFTWELKPLFDNSAGVQVDPLAQLKSEVLGGTKQITGPTAADKAAAAATKETGGRFDIKPASAPAQTPPAKAK